MKNKEKFMEVLEYCDREVSNAFVLNLSDESPILKGVSQIPLNIESAFIVATSEQNVISAGKLDGIPLNSTTSSMDSPKEIIIAVDGRKEKNLKVFYSVNNVVKKISAKSHLTTEEMIIVYWETEDTSCITFSGYDPIRENIVRGVINAQDEMTKSLLRGIARSYALHFSPSLRDTFSSENFHQEYGLNGLR